jgi:cell division protein FtsQ
MPPLTAPPMRMVRRQPVRRSSLIRWGRRGLKAAIFLSVVGAAAVAWHSGRLQTVYDQIAARSMALSLKAGFRVEQVNLVGRDQTDSKTVLAAAGLKAGDSILAFDPEAARQRIESLPWISSAAVQRHLPDTVTITIAERKPIALWQHNGKITLIDSNGTNLGTVAIESAPTLPLIVGGDAPAHVSELLAALNDHPELAKRVQASSWIGSRRWNLKLDNGIEIRLPETGMPDALQQLADAEASSRVLERDVAAIDLRLAGKMIVQLAHELPPPAKTKPQQGI